MLGHQGHQPLETVLAQLSVVGEIKVAIYIWSCSSTTSTFFVFRHCSQQSRQAVLLLVSSHLEA